MLVSEKEYRQRPETKRKWAIYVRQRNQHAQELIRRLKNKPCADCKDRFEHWQMDFDHRVQADKKFNISQPGARSIKNILEEIAKCDLVCANCHRSRTRQKEQYHSYARQNPVLLG
jgi:hypothetical protein